MDLFPHNAKYSCGLDQWGKPQSLLRSLHQEHSHFKPSHIDKTRGTSTVQIYTFTLVTARKVYCLMFNASKNIAKNCFQDRR